jgi:two-component system, OmpR family, sensor histidine kinase KdpD
VAEGYAEPVNRLSRLLLRPEPLSWRIGLATASAAVALTTAIVFGLRQFAPASSLGVVYLLAVVAVSILWGLRLGLLTALASTVAFNFFHIQPTGELTVARAEDWVALAVFLIVGAIASGLAELARSRTAEAEARRREADLMAGMARLMLGGLSVDTALPSAAQRLATALDLPSAAIERGAAPTTSGRLNLPLNDGGERLGTLVVPADLPPALVDRLRLRFVPALEALLAAAIQREELMRGAVETEALRRSDEIKTALLRSVSHDLRSPITAIRAASEALASPSLDAEDRAELEGAIASDAERLSRLVDNLLTLSSLRSGTAEPRWDWCSVEELIEAAADELGSKREALDIAIDPEVPLIRADGAQLERAFANLLSNAVRYAGSDRVSVGARTVSGRVVVSVADRGPGIPAAELDRVFEPFYRGKGGDSHPGSGLGLAIVKGFVEANGGTVRAESLPGQGTTFVVELPQPIADRATEVVR